MSNHDQKIAELRKNLESTLGPTEWTLLRKHAARDSVIIVSSSLELIDVGLAIALNEETKVKQWIDSGMLNKPTLEQLTIWEQELTRQFTSLIVQPFVLIQTTLS